MAISTYAELKTAVANWLERDDLTSRVPEFIALAENRIARDKRIRIRSMETTTDLTISSQETALPTGFLGARRLYLEGNPKIRVEFLPPEDFWIRGLANQSGQPEFFTIEGDSLVVGPSPDTTYTGKLLYWQKFTAFSADADTNWLLTEATGLYLYGALLEASPFLGDDERIMTWATLFDELADNVRLSDKRDRYSGAPLQMRSDVQVW